MLYNAVADEWQGSVPVAFDILNATWTIDLGLSTGMLFITGDLEGTNVTYLKDALPIVTGVITPYSIVDWDFVAPDIATATASFEF